MANPKNLTKWISTKLGYVSNSGQPNLQTQSGVNLQTQSGVNLILQPNTITPTQPVAWTKIVKTNTAWAKIGTIVTVGNQNITDNLGNLLTDNLGNFIVTNPTYIKPVPPTIWTPTGAS